MKKSIISITLLFAAVATSAQMPKAFEVSPGCKQLSQDIEKICGKVHRGGGMAQAQCFAQHSQSPSCQKMSKAEVERRKILARKEGREWRATWKISH